MSQENVEIVRSLMAAYNRRDLEAVRALNHPDVEVDWSASRGLEAGVYRGREEMTPPLQLLQTFQTVQIEPERFIASGEAVVVPNVTRLRGRDGVETVARSALVYELRDGLVSRLCLYQDTREALEAVGLSE